MKVVILAGGLGTRLAEETEVMAQAYGGNRWAPNSLAYHEALFFVWLQRICDSLRI